MCSELGLAALERIEAFLQPIWDNMSPELFRQRGLWKENLEIYSWF